LAGALPQTPLGSLQRSSKPHSCYALLLRGGEWGEEGKGGKEKGERGKRREGGGEGRGNLAPKCFCLASSLLYVGHVREP